MPAKAKWKYGWELTVMPRPLPYTHTQTQRDNLPALSLAFPQLSAMHYLWNLLRRLAANCPCFTWLSNIMAPTPYLPLPASSPLLLPANFDSFARVSLNRRPALGICHLLGMSWWVAAGAVCRCPLLPPAPHLYCRRIYFNTNFSYRLCAFFVVVHNSLQFVLIYATVVVLFFILPLLLRPHI